MLICECPNTAIKKKIPVLSEESMPKIGARCNVKLPPKATLKNYSSVGPFVVRGKKKKCDIV